MNVEHETFVKDVMKCVQILEEVIDAHALIALMVI